MSDFSHLDSGEFVPEENRDQLFAWFQTLPLSNKYETIHDLSDGDGFVEALQLFDQAHFSGFYATAGPDLSKELRDRMVEYIDEKLQEAENYYARKSLSDMKVRIHEDVEHGGVVACSRLLQLLLVCAVLCADKEEHITKLRELDGKVTLAISRAIMEIVRVKPSDSDGESFAPREYTNGNEECDKCAALQSEVAHLVSERKRLSSFNAQLKGDLDSALDIENGRSPANQKLLQLQKENNRLKESLEKMEYLRDELRTKCDELQDQVASWTIEAEQLRKKLAEMDKLKDEVNEWKHTAGQLRKFENQVKVYERKADDLAELRQQMKLVEGRNTELMKQNLELEQANGQVAALNNDIDTLQKSFNALSQENKLAVKRLEIANQERADLQDRIDQLETRNTSLESQQTTAQRLSDDLEDEIPVGMSLATEMVPTSVKEDLLRLQMENDDLRAKLKDQTEVQQNDSSSVISSSQVDSATPGNYPSNSTYNVTERSTPASMAVEQTKIEMSASGDMVLAQRDAQIQALEKELHFMRQNYGQQQKLMTAAWYRMAMKMENLSSNARVQAIATDHDRQKTFLEEQRNAVSAPIVNGSRPNPTVMPSPSPSSRSGVRGSFIMR